MKNPFLDPVQALTNTAFFLAAQLYLIFYKKFIALAFRIFDKSYLGIFHFTLHIWSEYSIIGWTIKKFRTFCLKWVKRFLVVSLWVVKHFTIPQRRFFSSRLCRVKWPITVPYSEKNANNGKERTHKTTIILKNETSRLTLNLRKINKGAGSIPPTSKR